MAAAAVGDVGGRQAPARSVFRPTVARLIATSSHHPHRHIGAHILGLDDAGFATSGCDRRALEHAGRGAFPL